jgi:hypothetical protein
MSGERGMLVLSDGRRGQKTISYPHITEDKPPSPHLTSLTTNSHLSPHITEDKPPPPLLTSLKTNNHLLSSHH